MWWAVIVGAVLVGGVVVAVVIVVVVGVVAMIVVVVTGMPVLVGSGWTKRGRLGGLPYMK